MGLVAVDYLLDLIGYGVYLLVWFCCLVFECCWLGGYCPCFDLFAVYLWLGVVCLVIACCLRFVFVCLVC